MHIRNTASRPSTDTGSTESDSPIRLSICMATYKRANFIGQTIDSILGQMQDGMELVIVDGASPDNTEEVVSIYSARHANVRYFKEDVNSGIDGDYDKAVSYARGEYCWLMTDDDLLKAGAVETLIKALEESHDLVVLNSEVWNRDYSSLLVPRFAPIDADRRYSARDMDKLFMDAAGAISFIGCVVIRRRSWLSRTRVPYYGTLFVHFGVIFQSPALGSVLLVAAPLIAIRYGNAMWTPRGFEIWMFKWPDLLWSFEGISAASKSMISAPQPWRQLRKLLLYRAMGSFGITEYRKFLRPNVGRWDSLAPRFVALVPASVANALASVYCLLFSRGSRTNVYDLARSVSSTWVARSVAQVLRVNFK